MVSKDKLTPEERVGLTANLTIFLGILYTSLSIAAISGIVSLSARGYGTKSIVIGCIIIGLGYGTRYGSKTCLYIATAFFGLLAAYFMYNFLLSKSINPIVRFVFSIWADHSTLLLMMEDILPLNRSTHLTTYIVTA